MTKSKIFLYLCLSFIGGIFLNSILSINSGLMVSEAEPSIFRIPLFSILIISILGILLISVPPFSKMAGLVVIGFCLIFFVAGIWRQQIALSKIENSPLQKFIGKEVTFIGLINEEPEIKERSIEFEVKIDKIKEKVLVTTNRYPEYQYGDKLKITGKLEEPKEYQGFNYKNYLLKDGILAIMNFPEIGLVEKNRGNFLKKNLISFRQKLEESLNKLLPLPQSAILEALLFGKEENISKQWKEKLNLTGTRHIAAVSGMNITIISDLIFGFLLWLGLWRRQAFYLSIILIIFYILMIGAPASAIRAGIMALLFLTAQHFGRLSSASRVIIFAATLMLWQNPLILRWDIGFQLSFLATLGMINLQSILSEKLKKIPDFLQLRNNLSATLAAQIFVFPILIFNFGQISIISPLTNIFILPLIPIITILGFIFSFIGIFWQSLAQILSWPSWLGISYILKIVDFSSKISWASLTFQNVPWIFLIISYLILTIIVWRLQESQKLKFLKY
jgi:competence protein ComEC